MTSTFPCNLIHTANALPLYIFLISLWRIPGFANIAVPPAGLPGFSASAICSTGHVHGMFCPGRIHVSVNTQTSASVSLMRASTSSSFLQAPLIFYVKIFINLVEHPGRYRGIVVLPFRAEFDTRCVLVCSDCSRRLVSSGSLLRQCIDLQSLGYQLFVRDR